MNTIVNLTPHEINVVCVDGSVKIFKPSGKVARVDSKSTLLRETDGIPYYRDTVGEVIDLPEEQSGIFLLVSMVVRMALPTRIDLVSPGDLIRDGKGQPTGCKGLKIN